MAQQTGRYTAAGPARVAEGWALERLTQQSRLFGANGMRVGADGRIYIAQVAGSQISAIDVGSGQIETVSPMGGDIIAPDDLVFDPQGNLYATEISEGRVSVRAPNGTTRVVCGDLPCANPITFYNGRLFAGECRPGGRIMELDLNGGAPRVIADNLMMPNAMEVGPDGKLYFPLMGTNEICRVSLDGGPIEKVAGDLGVPDAVKFDSQGFIVSTQVASGQVLRIDPRTGDKTVLATIAPGLDNLVFVGERLFVSNIAGQVDEVLADGSVRSVVPDGFTFPLGLAVDADGVLLIADGGFSYTLQPGCKPQPAGMFFTPGYPGYVRGVIATGAGEFAVTTAGGQVASWSPAKQEHQILADGFDRLFGIAATRAGALLFADAGTGRVLSLQSGNVEEIASALQEPSGVAVTADDLCLVAEQGRGRVVSIVRGGVDTVIDGLQQPQGLLVRGNLLYIVDAGAKELIEFDLVRKTRRTIAAGLPIGAPAGVTPKVLRPFPPLSGSIGAFAGIAAGADGTLYLSADAEGSVLALRPA